MADRLTLNTVAEERSVSKDEDVSREYWNLLRDAAARLLRMRGED
jgi:hypothetical protein